MLSAAIYGTYAVLFTLQLAKVAFDELPAVEGFARSLAAVSTFGRLGIAFAVSSLATAPLHHSFGASAAEFMRAAICQA
jgi:hypothetical protein